MSLAGVRNLPRKNCRKSLWPDCKCASDCRREEVPAVETPVGPSFRHHHHSLSAAAAAASSSSYSSSSSSSRPSSAGRLRLETYSADEMAGNASGGVGNDDDGDDDDGSGAATPTEEEGHVKSPDLDYTIGSGSLDTREVEELLRYEPPPTRRGRTRIPSAVFAGKRDGGAGGGGGGGGGGDGMGASAVSRDASVGSSQGDVGAVGPAIDAGNDAAAAAAAGEKTPLYKFHVNRENFNNESVSSQTQSGTSAYNKRDNDDRLQNRTKNNLNNGISKNAANERANLAEQQQQQQQQLQQGQQQQQQQQQPLFTQEEVNAKLKALELDFQNQLRDEEGGEEEEDEEGEAEKNEARKLMKMKIRKLEMENNLLKREADEIKNCMAEYEVTIQHLMRDKDALKAGKSDEVQEALQERDSALEELNSVERSFSDLHRRYEKTKSLIEGFKKNEESLKKVAEEWQQGLRKEQERYKALKAHAEEKLEMANKTIDRERKKSQNEMAGLQASLRKTEIKCSNLEKSLAAKVKENEELTTICDELIAKVGKN